MEAAEQRPMPTNSGHRAGGLAFASKRVKAEHRACCLGSGHKRVLPVRGCPIGGMMGVSIPGIFLEVHGIFSDIGGRFWVAQWEKMATPATHISANCLRTSEGQSRRRPNDKC